MDVPRSNGSPFALNARPSAIDKVGTSLLLPADQVLYRQGEASNSLYYLDSGAVMMSVESESGEPISVAVHGPRMFFGARSPYEEIHNATAVTLTESRVVRLSKQAVQRLLQNDPVFTRQFALHMMRRVAGLEEDQIDRAVNSLKKRLARALLILASLDVGGRQARVLDRMTTERLAQLLSADPRCIGKLLHEFREAGYLARDERLIVHSSLVRILLPANLEA